MAARRVSVTALQACRTISHGSSLSFRSVSTASARCSTVPRGAFACTRPRAAPWEQREHRACMSKLSPSHLAARAFSSTPTPRHGDLEAPKPGEERHVTFIDKQGQSHTFTVADGDNLLDIAQNYELDMEGACGGSCACSTCHVVVQDEAVYDKMQEPDDEENDMLDLAFGLTETSRLGCQVKMSKELDGLVVRLPSMTRNLQASDFK